MTLTPRKGPPEDGRSSTHGLSHRLSTLLTGRRLPLTLAILAMLLAAPSLWGGWVMDDHFHRIRINGSSRFPDFFGPSLDMFRFFNGNAEHVRQMMDVGVVPWWTAEELKAGFWRPLTVLTHWLDYTLWPDVPLLMHLQSVLWFGAAVGVVVLLYRRLMGATWVAGLAALLYAIDDAHGMPVGFLANRNVLPATLFGVLTLLIHIKWRRSGWQAGIVLGPLCLAVGLLFKEEALSATAYLFAFAVFLDQGTLRRRLTTLVPYAVVVVVWRVVWTYLDYGVWGMGPYVDPLTEPLRYATSCIDRMPVLLLAQWALPPAEASLMLEPDTRRVFWFVAVAFVLLLVFAIYPLLRRDRLARFWATGMLLCLFPCCATFPGDRMLFFVGIGGMGLLASFLTIAFGARAAKPASLGWRIPAMALAVVFILLHGIAAPILLPLRARYPMGPPSFIDQLFVHTPLDRSIEDQDLILVNPPSPFHAIYVPIMRDLAGEPVPRHTRILAPGYCPMTIRRPDPHTLVIRPQLGYLSWSFDHLFRGPQVPMTLGQQVELTGLTIEVTAMTADNRPAEAAFRFAVPLEDASLRWLYWKDGAFVPFTPPPAGETLELPIAMPEF